MCTTCVYSMSLCFQWFEGWEGKLLRNNQSFLAFFEDYICYQTQTFHNFLYYFVLKALISFTSNLLIRILSHQISFPAEKFVRDIKISYLTSVKPRLKKKSTILKVDDTNDMSILIRPINKLTLVSGIKFMLNISYVTWTWNSFCLVLFYSF